MVGIVPKIQKLVLNSYPWPDRVRNFMLSDKGLFTIFFWAPWFKWGIVLANIGDLVIPAQNVSLPQQLVVGITGCVWSKWAFQIYPMSWNFFAVNAFMATTGFYQLSRK